MHTHARTHARTHTHTHTYSLIPAAAAWARLQIAGFAEKFSDVIDVIVVSLHGFLRKLTFEHVMLYITCVI